LYDSFIKKELDLVVVKTASKNEFKSSTELSLEKLVWVGDEKLVKKGEIIPLVVSPKPCVYRESLINDLEKNNLKWRIAFSSHSYAGKIAALKAGIGITSLPKKMVPSWLNIIKSNILPKLKDSHICLLKNNNKNLAVNSFEDFVIKNLR
jgi:DNA-binding transcriptional LysR family regulator